MAPLPGIWPWSVLSEIAAEMRAIKDSPEFNNLSNKVYLQFIEEQTGYKSNSVYRFLRAHEALGNIQDFATIAKLPETEPVLRPLATKALNADPERQAAIWEQVVEMAGDKEITAAMASKLSMRLRNL